MGLFDRAILAWKAMTDPRSIDPNYGTSLQIISPGQPVWTPKNYANFVKEGYRRTASVYACINKIATTASGIKWKLYTDRTMKREIEEHPLLDLWRKPNLNESQGMFVEKLFGFWHLSGNDYIWAYRPQKNGPPMALWHLRPDRVKIVPSTIGIESYVYGYGTPGVKTYEPEDTLHIKFPAYDDDYYGLSPMETASQLIDQQNEGNAWNTALMQNAGKPASAFFAKGFLTDAARNQIKDELRRKYSGKRNAGMPLVLEGDMTWQNMSMSPYELDWLQSRELNTREIASIFDVAPELIGDSAGKTFANVSEARQALYTENVLPKMDRVVDHVNNWLVPMYGDLKEAYFTYDKEDIEALASLYQAALTARSERATNLWNSTQCTLDEAREMQDLPPLPQGKGKVFKIVGPTILVPADEIDEYAEQSMSGPELPPPAIAEIPPDAQQQLPPAGGTSASQQGNNNAAPTNNRNGNTDNNDDKQPNSGNNNKKRYVKTSQEANYKVWKCAPDACEFCMQNDGKMVAIDAKFPNGCSTPSDCHKFCKCQGSLLYIPDDIDQSHVASWGFATLAAAYGVALLASRHANDVAAQREKEQEDEENNVGKHRGIIDHDQKYKKALQIFTVDDRYLRMRSLPIRTETSTQERHNGLSGDRQQTTKAATRALIGTKEPVNTLTHRRKRRRSAYSDFIGRYE
jgi:HK97 family phage portal protein